MKITLGDRADPRISKILSYDRPLLCGARQSGQRGAAVNRHVGRDAHQMADSLSLRLGIDITQALPSVEAIAEGLRVSTEVLHSIDRKTGKPFINAFTTFDLRPHGAPVILMASAGSAHKLHTDGIQPAVRYLADRMLQYKPSLVFFKQDHRMYRVAWPQAPMWLALDDLKSMGFEDVYLGDGEKGIRDTSAFGQAQSLIDGFKAQQQAAEFFKISRASMDFYTGDDLEMRDGRVPFHITGGIPPGFMRVTLTARGASRNIKQMIVDEPDNWPAQRDSFTVLPTLTDADGELVSQVANLRWYLATAGHPGHTWDSLERDLVNRGWSTNSLRDRYGPDASGTYDPDSTSHHLQHTILENLDIYETGQMTRKLDEKVKTFTNLFPPDGQGWATAEDFQRVRRWRADSTDRYSLRSSYTFSALPVTYNGEELHLGVLPGRANKWPDEPSVRYSPQKPYATRRSTPKAPGGYKHRCEIHHDWIATGIAEALTRATTVPLPTSTRDHDPDASRQLQDKVRDLTGQLNDTNLRIRVNDKAIKEIDDEGEFVAPLRQRRRMHLENDELEGTRDLLTIQLRQAQDDLSLHHARQQAVARGLEIGQALDVVYSLRDPYDTTYRDLWRTCIDDFQIRAQRVKRFGHKGTEVKFSFTLRISQDGTTLEVPVTQTALHGAVADLDLHVNEAIAGLRQGAPIRGAGQLAAMRPLISKALGADERAVYLRIDEPALLRLTMAVLHPEHRPRPRPGDDFAWTLDDPEWVKVFTRPDVLAARLVEIYRGDDPPLMWHVREATWEVRALVHAALHRGQVTAESFGPAALKSANHTLYINTHNAWWTHTTRADSVLPPCGTCGSHQRALTRLGEVAEYLCLSCRTDATGVTWPADRFDRYVTRSDLWVEAGVTIDTTDDTPWSGTPDAKMRPRQTSAPHAESDRFRP